MVEVLKTKPLIQTHLSRKGLLENSSSQSLRDTELQRGTVLKFIVK